MDEVGVYVVRIYRRNAGGLAGVVQSVSSGEQLPFRGMEELWRVLYDLPSPRQRNEASQPEERD
jgi:hypothetical protein